MKKFSLFVVAAIIGLSPLLVPVGAQARSSSGDPIRSGLNQAYSLIFGSSRSSSGSGGTTAPATPAPQAPTAGRPYYAALGDSVAAGLGLPGVANPAGYDSYCGRSSQAYSSYVARSQKLPVISAACSGATAGDIYTRQAVPNATDIPAQLDTIAAYGKPQLVTITAGANDAHWRQLLGACYLYDCTQTRYQVAADAYLAAARTKVQLALATVNQRYEGQPPRVVITGYYSPVSAACADQQTAITPAELNWIARETAALNQAISNAASYYSNVTYVPISFSGHDICSSTPWVQGQDAAAPFHPTAAGQRYIASRINSTLRQ